MKVYAGETCTYHSTLHMHLACVDSPPAVRCSAVWGGAVWGRGGLGCARSILSTAHAVCLLQVDAATLALPPRTATHPPGPLPIALGDTRRSLEAQMAAQQKPHGYAFRLTAQPFQPIDLFQASPFHAILERNGGPASVPAPPLLVRMPGGQLCVAQRLKAEGTLHGISSGPGAAAGTVQLWCSVTHTEDLTSHMHMTHVQVCCARGRRAL